MSDQKEQKAGLSFGDGARFGLGCFGGLVGLAVIVIAVIVVMASMEENKKQREVEACRERGGLLCEQRFGR